MGMVLRRLVHLFKLMERHMSNGSSFAKIPELPKRSSLADLNWVKESAAKTGANADVEACLHAEAEWTSEMGRAVRLRDASGLSEGEWQDFLGRLRSRHVEVWGQFSQAD